MRRKETEALYYEICSRVHPIKGMYKESSTEKERLIKKALNDDTETHLAKLESSSIESLFKSLESNLETEETLMKWYKTLTKYYSHEVIPDSIYIKLITIANQNDFKNMKKLLTEEKQSAY